MSSAKSKTGTITCETFNGSESLGTNTCSFTANVSNENAPTLNPKVYISDTSDTYKLTGSTTKLIRHYTWASYEINATAQNGATITSQSMTNGGNTYTKSSGQMDKAIVSGEFLFKATDSRGFTTQQTFKVDIVDYIYPSCVVQADVGSDGTLTVSITGQFFNGSFGAVDNSLQVAYKYKESGGTYSEWYYVTPTISGNTYKATGVSKNLDYTKSYSIQAWAGDVLYERNLNEGIYTDAISVKSYPLFDWGENDFNFNVPIKMLNNTVFNYLNDNKHLVISPSGGNVYIRPKGISDTTGQMVITPSGHVAFGNTTTLFPIGSCYITSTNVNPSNYLGGTWTLIKKKFKYTWFNTISSFFTVNTTNVSSTGSSVMIRNGETIRIRLNLVTSKALGDDTISFGQLKFDTLGINELEDTTYVSGYTDGGGGIAQCHIYYGEKGSGSEGKIESLDVITKTSGGTIPSGSTLIIDFILVPQMEHMMDSECDEFIWERTS